MTNSHSSLNIFLVEDVKLIRDSLIEALRDVVGAQVVGDASSEPEAIGWLLAHPDTWQLAVIDLFLKQGSGVGVLRAVVQRASHQRAVVLTNYPTPDIRKRCLAAGADQVFDKSTQLDEFLEYCGSL